MKKILLLSLSLIAFLFLVSCTNDDITIDKVLPKHTITYNVSTQEMYDTFGQVNYIRENYLREDTLCIGVSTFVYDSNGNLVDTKTNTLKNFNATQQSFENLVEGKYTLVTVETLLNPINSNKSSCWSIDDTDKLSTLKITQTSRPSRANIIGVCTESVSVSGDVTLNVTPKAIGSLINFYCYNFENSNFVRLGFGTQDILKYYSLDPQIQGKNKYNKDLTASGKFNLRCSITAERASQGYYIPTYVLESEIDWMNAAQDDSNANTSSWWTWKSTSATLEDGKVYEAGFYYLYSVGDNDYADSFFGDQSGFDVWKKEIDDFVKSLTAVFEEPYTTWGGSVASVKSYMSGYTMGGSSTKDDGSYVLWYYGKNREDEVDYYFTSATGGLFLAYIFLNSEEVGEDELSSAFNEMGYTYVGSGDGFKKYKKSANVYIEVGLNSQNYWYVAYYDPAQFTRKYTAREIRTFAPKREVSKRSSEASFDRSSLMDKLRKCEDAVSVKHN